MYVFCSKETTSSVIYNCTKYTKTTLCAVLFILQQCSNAFTLSITAYKDLQSREDTRNGAWQQEGWDEVVYYTGEETTELTFPPHLSYWAHWPLSRTHQSSKTLLCNLLASSSHSAHGFQDYDPYEGLPAAVNLDLEVVTLLNVASTQSICYQVFKLSAAAVTIPSLLSSLLKMSEGQRM